MSYDSKSDAELLNVFSGEGDEVAFEELVRRHFAMVFGVGMRKTGDRTIAEEVAQNTFAVLAKKAKRLKSKSNGSLGGWLHRVAAVEAAEAMRKEYRRKRAMKKLIEESPVGATDSIDPGLAAALPELDDAMARLSESDRSAILLRFHDGMKFREMAEQTGKTEEASRKQVKRALGKLSSLLRRKGKAVPAAVLATGLGASLTQHAPASAAVSTVAQKALAAAPAAAGAFVSLKLFFLTVTETKVKLGIVAGVLLVVFGSSFVAGRRAAAEFGAAALAVPAIPESVLRANEEKRSDGVAPKRSRSVREILEEAATIYRGGDMNTARHRAALVLSELNSADVDEAVDYLESIRGEGIVFYMIAQHVLGLWAKSDGESAIAWAEENAEFLQQGTGYRQILRNWSRHEPEAAYAWYLEKAKAGSAGMNISSFRWLPTSIFAGWAAVDPVAAVAALEDIAPEDERGAMGGIAETAFHSIDRQPVLDAVAAMPDDSRIKSKLLEEVAEDWAREEPHAAAAWLDSVPVGSAMAKFRAKAEVAEEWFAHDPDAIMSIGAWMLSGAPDEMRGEIIEAVQKAASQLTSKRSSGGG